MYCYQQVINHMEIKSIAWLHHQKALRGKATWELHNDAACYFEQILAAATHKKATTVTCLQFHKPSKTNKRLLENQG